MIYISLGWNCSPAIMRKNYFKHSKKNGYLTTPFDLCVTPYSSLCDSLNDDFSLFFNLKIVNGIIMNDYNMWFNHEAPTEFYKDNDFFEFKKKYNNRINNLKKYLNSNNIICFLLSNPFDNINKLYDIIIKKYPNLKFKILVLRDIDTNIYLNHFSKNSDCKIHSEISNIMNFNYIEYKNTQNIFYFNKNMNLELFIKDHTDFNIFKDKYGEYYVPKGLYKGIDWFLQNGFTHEESTLLFISRNINNGSIITAGTFIGTFLPFLSNVSKNVYAFEPVPENFRFSVINIENNLLKNVDIKNTGLSNNNESKYMKTENLIEKSLCRIVNKEDSDIEIICSSLDNLFCESNDIITIIQLDVKGYEYFILEGGIELIRKNMPILILENNNDDTIIPIFLKDLGYKLYNIKYDANIILYVENLHNIL